MSVDQTAGQWKYGWIEKKGEPRGWASTCVRPEDGRFSLFTGMISMQKFASSNFGTTWPLYAMNQKCYYDCPKIIVVNSKHLK